MVRTIRSFPTWKRRQITSEVDCFWPAPNGDHLSRDLYFASHLKHR
jgi:hypothetical protein